MIGVFRGCKLPQRSHTSLSQERGGGPAGRNPHRYSRDSPWPLVAKCHCRCPQGSPVFWGDITSTLALRAASGAPRQCGNSMSASFRRCAAPPSWSIDCSLLPWRQTSCCSDTKSCLTLRDPMDRSTPGFPVLHHLLELTHTHVH